MKNERVAFHILFNKARLKAQMESMRDFAKLLAEQGFVYEDSLLSKWKRGVRVPKDRTIVFAICNAFARTGGIETLAEANSFFASLGFMLPNEIEKQELSELIHQTIPSSLPLQIDHLIRREHLLKEISWHLLNGKMVTLSGMSGSGKTVLSIEIGYLLQKNYQTVIWCSANAKDTNNLLDEIIYFCGGSATKLSDLAAKVSILLDLIKDQNMLIIVDDISDPDAFARLFTDNKISFLFTSLSDTSASSSAITIRVDHFTDEEADNLSSEILGRLYFSSNQKKIREFYALVGYLPLGLHVVLKQIEKSPSELTLLLNKLKAEKFYLESFVYDNKSFLHSLQIAFTSLPANFQKIFASLGVFPAGHFSLQAVAYLNSISNLEAEHALSYLHSLSLIERNTNNRYRIHPLIKLFLAQKYIQQKLYYDLVRYYRSYLQDKQEIALHTELDNIVGVYKVCLKRRYYEPIMLVWDTLGPLLWNKGYWIHCRDLGLIVYTSAKKTGNLEILMKCCIREIAWCYFCQADIKNAEKYAQEGLAIALSLHNEYFMAYSFQRLGKVYQIKKDTQKALEYFQKALIYFKANGCFDRIGATYQYIGETYALTGDLTKAEYYLKTATNILDSIKDISQKAIVYNQLGSVYTLGLQFKKAESYFKDSLTLEKSAGRKAGGAFWNNIGLGVLYKESGKERKSALTFARAKQDMLSLGVTKDVYTNNLFFLLFQNKLPRDFA